MIISNKPNIYDNIIQPSGGSGGGGTDPADKTRITNLENNESKVLYYEAINSTTGTVTAPTNTVIFLNDFPQGYDAVVETIVNGEPTGQIAKTSGGTPITVTSFNTGGSYTLSGTPASFPVALLYVLRVKALNYSNLTFDNIIESQNFSVGNASDVVFTPNGDIAATDVQSAIVEVRDDTDTKLALKLAKASNLSDVANAATSRANLGVKGYTITNYSTASNPADATTYYIGSVGTMTLTTAGLGNTSRRKYINQAGTITSAQIYIINGTVDATTENATLYCRINDTTDYLISNAVQFSSTANGKVYNITGLNIPITAGDFQVSKLVCPTWATNPAAMHIEISYYVE